MAHPGGTTTIWRAALVALVLLLGAGACSGTDDPVTAGDRATSSSDPDGGPVDVDGDGVEVDEADLDDDGDDGTTTTAPGADGGSDDTDTDAAAGSTTTTTPGGSKGSAPSGSQATPTTAAPTTAPPPTAPPATAAPTTAPPPPPTTAPPPPPPPPTTAPPSSSPQHGARNTGCEQFMAAKINEARATIGVAGLSFDTGIQHVAINWSDEMSGSQTLKHNPNYGPQIAAIRPFQYAAENVGRGYAQEPLFQAFMDSPGHRKNIENGVYSHLTVGCLTDSNGQLWVTQNFWG